MAGPKSYSSLLGRLLGRGAAKRRRKQKKQLTPRNALHLEALEPRHLLSATTAIQDGDWHDPSTWDNGIPDATSRAIIGQGVTVQLSDQDHVAQELVALGTLNVPEEFVSFSPTSDPTQLGENKVKVYYDGSLAGSTQGSQLWKHTGAIGIGGVNGNTKTHAGNQSSAVDVTFGGRIDDLLNYNRALPADEIAQLHANGRGSVYLAPTEGLAAAWNFDRGNLNDIARGDSIDDNGTFVGGSLDDSVWYLNLDGEGDQVNVSKSTELNQGTFPEKTVSVWFHVDSLTGRQMIYEQGGTTRGLNIYLEGNTLYAGGWNTSNNQSGWDGNWVAVADVTANQWHHVTLVIDGDGGERISTPLNGGTKTLTTRWMHVNSGGVFQIGTSADRYDEGNFVLTLTGTDPDADHVVETAGGTINITDNDGFLMTDMGGRLQFFGADKLSFTKLAATASVDATEIIVKNVIERKFTDGETLPSGEIVTSAADDGALNWVAGDQIVIASSSHDYREEDVRTIEAITDNGDGTSTLTLDSPLTYQHFGEIETYSNATRSWEIDMRAEVGLLSRNVRIQGTEDTDNAFGDRANANYENVQRPDFVNGGTTSETVQDVTNGVGAHTMIMADAGQITVDGVQLDLMGQAGRAGRYPIHWHVAGDRSGDVLQNTSITNSNNRGVTIHGTQNLHIEGVLLHDVHGHGFFFEDGVETGNQLTANIAFGIHRVGSRLKSNNFHQDETWFDPFTVDLHDDVFVKGVRGVLSAAFWVTNPNNDFVGNVTAGSQGMGFWYVGVEEPLGSSAETGLYDGYKPFEAPMGRNEYSTVHATGTGFGLGKPGFNPPFFTEFTADTFHGVADHLTAYKNHFGVWLETQIDFNELRAADNHNSFRALDEVELRNSLVVGDSLGNSAGNYDPFNRHPNQLSVTGIAIYQEGINVVDTHFAGFQAADAFMFNFQINDKFNRFASTFQGISYEGNDRNGQLHATPTLATPEQFDNEVLDSSRLYDSDGSLTGIAGATLVFNNPFLQASNAIQIGTHLYRTADKEFGKITLERLSGSASSTPVVSITAGDGDATELDQDNDFEQVVLLNDGDTRITFNTLANWGDGFDLDLAVDTDAGTPADASGIFVLEGLPSGFSITNATLVGSIAQVRDASTSSYFIDANGDIWVKVFANDQDKLMFRN